MKKTIRLTESDLIRIVKRILKEDHDMDDAKHTMLRGKGYSHSEKNDGKEYIVFDGQKFAQEDIRIADYHDLGKLPRVEDGYLIIANPAWSM